LGSGRRTEHLSLLRGIAGRREDKKKERRGKRMVLWSSQGTPDPTARFERAASQQGQGGDARA